jgi:hypothetical protein
MLIRVVSERRWIRAGCDNGREKFSRRFLPASRILVRAASYLLAWAQAQEGELPITSPQVQAATSAQKSTAPPQSEAQKKPERIFGVVPAYSITDAQNAPPLTSK